MRLPKFLVLIWTCMPLIALSLTLSDAEQMAIHNAPELEQAQAQADELKNQAIAQGQLPDPKLMMSATNVPTDTFSFNQDDMTQLGLGVEQEFPRGHSLKAQQQQTEHLSQAQSAKKQELQTDILRQVRMDWLTLFDNLQRKKILLQQKQLFDDLLKITESLLENNKTQQKDVAQAQLNLLQLDNEIILANTAIANSRHELARWIGVESANQAQPKTLPQWPKPPTSQQLQQELTAHPQIQVDKALIAAGESNVDLAKQQYYPGFALSVDYDYRAGHEMGGEGKRSDMVSAKVTLDLPLFTSQRQDKNLQASQQNLIAQQQNQIIDYRNLNKLIANEYDNYQNLSQSAQLYRSKIIAQAKQYSQATLIAYQNDQTDFKTLSDSYIQELNSELSGLTAEVAAAKARANLLYIQGK